MSLRCTFGILALASLSTLSSASMVQYRVTGLFDEAYGDYEPLLGTTFAYDFAYDTNAPDLGDPFTAFYAMESSRLQTNWGLSDGVGEATIDLDSQHGSMGFWGTAKDPNDPIQGFGLIFPDLDPQTGQLPIDLEALAKTNTAMFYMSSVGGGTQNFGGFGYAVANRITVQSVPEPASIAAVMVGTVGLLRRRRR